MTLSVHLKPEAVVLGLAARTRNDVLRGLAERCATALGGEPATILRALSDREALGSTGVGHGVAMPHAAIAGLAAPFALAARLAAPIDWQAIDDQPVDLVVVVLSPSEGPAGSPNPIAKFARRLRAPETRARLRAAPTAAAFHAALTGPID
ncbi:PTS sugar transporter subunit IIA [Siculibacillus lacustris]|uniref:PTS sugar transporter subunit IIA n=1 Tax=Siculibacillus lacustris TaxID=1549641 RepID=A0A4Q9VY91_9HYPH|nr:PTS sugar transporter subunit IIA [Siculibacillus lacustris]TBW41370.1 PTS sugar transporter subunit IIA [Siculibacillus lacustris]